MRIFGNIALAVATFALIGWATAASAQSPCNARAVIADNLHRKFGETPRVQGVVSGASRILEVFANDETGTWTVVMSEANGRSCMLSSGEAFQLKEAKQPETPT